MTIFVVSRNKLDACMYVYPCVFFRSACCVVRLFSVMMSSRVSSAALIAVHTCRRCLYNSVSVTPNYLLTRSQTTTLHTQTRLLSSSVSAKLESPVYDVVISGGGMVGTAAAAALGESVSQIGRAHV